MMLALSRRPRRLKGSVVTCGRPTHVGWKSGRNVTTSSTRRLATRSNGPIEQIKRCRIDPVDVLEHDQHWGSCSCAIELIEKRHESHLALLLRADRQRRVALVRRNRQQLSDERHVARQICRCWLEQRHQLVELRAGAAVRLEARGLLKLRNERMQRAVRMVRRAEIAKASMRLALDPSQQAFSDARLANARLTREQHNATLAGLGLIPPAQQQVHLLLATNEWGQRASAPRVEPADASRLTAHLPRLQRLRQSVALVGSERAAIEHADPPGAACWPQ